MSTLMPMQEFWGGISGAESSAAVGMMLENAVIAMMKPSQRKEKWQRSNGSKSCRSTSCRR